MNDLAIGTLIEGNSAGANLPLTLLGHLIERRTGGGRPLPAPPAA